MSGKILGSGAADCAHGMHRKCRKAVVSGQWSVVSFCFWVCGEPRQHALFEFLWGGAYCSAVVGVGDFPQNYFWIAGLDLARVANGYVAVDLAVNQEDWDLCGCYGIFWRDLLHIEMVLGADVEERKFDYWAEEGASEPRAHVKGLTHAVVGDFAEAGEGRFGGDGAEARLCGQGLQEFGCAHGFS